MYLLKELYTPRYKITVHQRRFQCVTDFMNNDPGAITEHNKRYYQRDTHVY